MKGLLTEIWEELRKQKMGCWSTRGPARGEGINLPGPRGQREWTVSSVMGGRPSGGFSNGRAGSLPDKWAGAEKEIPGCFSAPPSRGFPDTSSCWLSPNWSWQQENLGACSPLTERPFPGAGQQRKDGRMNSGGERAAGGPMENNLLKQLLCGLGSLPSALRVLTFQ